MGSLKFVAVLTSLASLASPARADDKARLCREQAEQCGQALVDARYDKLLACTHPRVISAVGGPQAMTDAIVSGRIKARAQGFEVLASTASLPRDFGSVGVTTYAIVPTTATVKTPAGKVLQRSFFVAISNDGGKTWKFVDGSKLTDDNIRSLLPDFPLAHLKLPAAEEPVLLEKARAK